MTRIYMWAKHAVTTDTRRATQIDMCRAPVRRPSRFRVLIELRSDFSCAVLFFYEFSALTTPSPAHQAASARTHSILTRPVVNVRCVRHALHPRRAYNYGLTKALASPSPAPSASKTLSELYARLARSIGPRKVAVARAGGKQRQIDEQCGTHRRFQEDIGNAGWRFDVCCDCVPHFLVAQPGQHWVRRTHKFEVVGWRRGRKRRHINIQKGFGHRVHLFFWKAAWCG